MPKHKSRPKKYRIQPYLIDAYDNVAACCEKIDAIAELVACSQSERLRPGTISIISDSILDETAKLRQAVKPLVQPRPRKVGK